MMTQYIEKITEPIAELGPLYEPPPEAGWTYAVKPAWTHDLLDLWEPNKLVVLLLEMATDRIAQDVPNPNTRRRTLAQIARYFVPQTGLGRRSRTASPNPWAAFSQLYRASTLAPAYLVHIATQNDMAHAAASLLHHNYQIGDTVALSDVRRHLVVRFGDRRTVHDSASAILRTFAHFGVLSQYGRSGEYRFTARQRVDVETFPLLMWAWWLASGTAVIELPQLVTDPLLAFVDHASYADHWQKYAGSLWALETRGGVECAILRPADNAEFIRTLFNLLSSHPKWPRVSRHFPEP